MHEGKPVILLDIGGIPETVQLGDLLNIERVKRKPKDGGIYRRLLLKVSRDGNRGYLYMKLALTQAKEDRVYIMKVNAFDIYPTQREAMQAWSGPENV